MRRLPTALIALLALALQGCGALFATYPNPEGEPVMLLGHDPVAYFRSSAGLAYSRTSPAGSTR